MASAQRPSDPIEEGVTHHRAGELDRAEACYRRVLARDPDHPAASQLLGLVAKKRGDLEAAVAHMERALARQPDYPEVHYNLGNTRWLRGELEAAVACYDRALAGNPDYELAWVNRGRSLQHLGRTAEAAESFRAATEVRFGSGLAWENLSLTGRFEAGDPEVERMRAALDAVDPAGPDAKGLHFALGKARADQGEHDRAFAHYGAGNRLVRDGVSYDVGRDEAILARIAETFTPGRLAALGGQGGESRRPIFILGMPRSGTTLVEQMLASHPQVAGGGERYDLDRVVGRVRAPDRPEVGFPGWLPSLGPPDLTRIGEAYLARLPETAEARITDKMPGNFRYVGLIHRALPNAAILHVRRSPADTCLSCYLHNFTNGHHYSFDQAELGRYYRAYHGLMAHWRSVLPAGAFLEVDYEALVSDPEEQVGRILAYCGLPWDDACLRFHETERPVQTASMEQVRQPLYGQAVARWRRYAPFLGPLFAALGDLAPDRPDAP